VTIWCREQSGILQWNLCIPGEAADLIKVLLTDLSGNGQSIGPSGQEKRHQLVSAGGAKENKLEN
jgi:hypothetical protein